MSGQVIIPSPEVGGGSRLGGGGGNSRVTASQVNGFRITAVVDRLGLNMELPNPTRNESLESFNLCLSLARGIDFSMANHEIPSRAPDLPLLLKKVCQCRNDAVLQAAVMVLMMSVKNACQSGWFSDKDAEELNNLAQEVASNFCTSMDFNTEPNGSNAVIATIMSRFYPRMKMRNILTFLEVKPGYGAYVGDFQISKRTRHSPDEKIRLFVAQTDSTETSSCLVNPTKVNILVNGKGVDRRNTVFTDTGPQMPTHVAHMLRYGTNLLQAVGQFNGNYIIVLAWMTEISEIEIRTLQDYVQPNAVIVDPDSELIEGPSRISLNCPISFKRIRTPVKGHACKHLQCFDFENYMDMNAKRPSWRCPHCNHHCCFTEIRIDQNMGKVLKEVGEGVNDVIISSDGSWKAIMESGDNAEKRQDKFPRLDQDELTQPDSPGELMDLTEVDDVIDATSTCEAEERKVLPNTSANLSSVPNTTSSSESNSINEARRSTLPQIEDNFWSGIYLSTFQSGTPPSAMLDAQIGGILESSPCSVFSSPVFTDTVSPALNSGVGPLNANGLLANSALRNEITSPTALQLQQFQFGNSAVNNEYGRSLPIPWHISRTPVAVQALPAQASTTISPRQRNSANTSIQNSHLAASQTPALSALGDGFNTNSSNIERQQPFSRSHPSALQVPRMSSQQQNSNSLATYQGYSGRQNEVQNSSPQQISNLRMSHSTNQSAGRLQQSAQSSGTFFQSQNSLGGSQGVSSLTLGSSNNRFSAAQRAAQVTRAFQTPRAAASSGNVDLLGTSSVGGLRGALGSTPQSVPRPDVGANSTADKDWRPTGRMRGSLSGKAYSDALNQYIRPTQEAQAGSTPPNLNPSASTPSAALEILMANRAALQAAGPSTASGSVCGASGAFSLESTTGRQ